jgi:dipeptidyl aminopeptidase/acylaminoacyl peptidase
MVNALRNRGIEVEYMVKENEGHGFLNQNNQFDFYGAMEKFLDKHLKSGNN